MAAMTSSSVTIHEIWKSDGTSGRRYKYLDVTLALSTQGGLTDYVGRDLFGLVTIEGCGQFRTSASVVQGMAPSYDKTKLVAYVAETNGSPANVSATVRGVVWGLEKATN